jgi:hypothetical protein
MIIDAHPFQQAADRHNEWLPMKSANREPIIFKDIHRQHTSKEVPNMLSLTKDMAQTGVGLIRGR